MRGSAVGAGLAEVDRGEQGGQVGLLVKRAIFINATLTPLKQMRSLIAASRFATGFFPFA